MCVLCVDGVVKLSIKLFIVLELFVDLLEIVSVVSLKVELRILVCESCCDDEC